MKALIICFSLALVYLGAIQCIPLSLDRYTLMELNSSEAPLITVRWSPLISTDLYRDRGLAVNWTTKWGV